MSIDGTVRVWHDDEGWGVLDTAETPGGCWAHFSAAAIDGYVTFTPGAAVKVEFEGAGQDGYAYRATRFWPADRTPEQRTSSTESAAYTSSLTLYFD